MYQSELDSFIKWVQTVIREGDCAHVTLSEHNGYFYFNFPLRANASPIFTKNFPQGKNLRFLVINEYVERLEGKWVRIFESSHLKIFEKKISDVVSAPLRWGLVQEEKNILLQTAKRAISRVLFNQPLLKEEAPSERLMEKRDVTVSLWVDGKLRGARLRRDLHLFDGVLEAATDAAKDNRFRPLRVEEQSKIQVQISILSYLRIQPSLEYMEQNIAESHLGYELTVGKKQGFFLPHIFKLKPPKNLQDHLRHLVHDKLGSKDGRYPKNFQLRIFSVEDFIEQNGTAVPFKP